MWWFWAWKWAEIMEFPAAFYGAENGKVWMTYPGSRILDRGFAMGGSRSEYEILNGIGELAKKVEGAGTSLWIMVWAGNGK